MLMVNKAYVTHGHELHNGDEVGADSPVSGGGERTVSR